MRSNLLSLQNIASRQDIVQNRLATGLKVSSAIDNPSSYYTASSLNNRATDLTALLDAMSQGIQTIKAASEAIDSGTKFLEQAKAVANQALEKSADIAAKVSNEAELLAAIASGKEGLIVLENDIIMSENQTIQLQKGQSLVGAAYLGSSKKTSLTFNITGNSQDAIQAADNSLFSDFTVNYNTDIQNNSVAVIHGRNTQDVTVQNMDINVNSSHNNGTGITAIRTSGGSMHLKGINNIKCNGLFRTYGVMAAHQGQMDIEGKLNIKTTGTLSFALVSTAQSSVTLKKGMIYNVDATSYALLASAQSTVKSENNVTINTTAAFGAEGSSGPTYGGNTFYFSSGTKINVLDTALINLSVSESINPHPGYNGNVLAMEAGVEISWKNGANIGTWRNDNEIIIDRTTTGWTLSPLNIPGMNKISDHFVVIPDIDAEMAKDKEPAEGYKADYGKSSEQYNLLLTQYNSLMGDAAYKGINLLDGQNLKINFNEDRSSKIEVAGVKAGSESLGLKTKEWKTAEDIEKSVSELEEAINSLRSFASAFGNYYSIVTTRQDFTENLINVLEEGADKLTLADMNQESANMLALQTSQQLAVNSLSLASQASQAVLRLF